MEPTKQPRLFFKMTDDEDLDAQVDEVMRLLDLVAGIAPTEAQIDQPHPLT